MTANPWHKRYHADALNGYMPLSLEERGAYTTLLDLLYDRGEPIPENERLLAGYFGVSVRKARAMVEALIQKGKIIRTGTGFITNSRFENELKTSRKRAENGAKGGRNRAENDKNGNEINDRTENGFKQTPKPQKPEARSQIDRDKSLSGEPTIEQPFEAPDRTAEQERFPEFWAVFPCKVRMDLAEAAFMAAAIKTDAEVIIDGAKRYAASRAGKDGDYTQYPAKWLKERRWTDQYAQPPATAPSAHSRRMRALAARFGECP